MNITRGSSLASATFSEDGRYRYRLTRDLLTVHESVPRRTVCWIMLNPSTADEIDPDPTVRRCCGFTRLWGFDRVVIVNLFALRATDPRRLDGDGDPAGPDNDLFIGKEAAAAERVIVAWGGYEFARRTGRDRAVLDMLRRASLVPRALRVNRDGSPAHPLYLPRTCRPVEYTA